MHLFASLLGRLRVSVPVLVCGMHGIFIDNDCFPPPLTFLGRHRPQNGQGGMDVGRTEKGKSVVVMRLRSDRRNDWRGKRMRRLQFCSGAKDLDRLTRNVDPG